MKNQQTKTIALSNPVEREEMVQMMMMTFLPVVLMVAKLIIVSITAAH